MTHLGAHNSPFLRDATTSFSLSGNHYYNSTIQLDYGVRLLTAQLHRSNGDVRLCHTACNLLDAGPLETWLSELGNWIDNHPCDVVTLVLINTENIAANEIVWHFETANIIQYAYVPPSTTDLPSAWPTLQNLIATRKRLMVFIASLEQGISSDGPFLMDEFRFIWENEFENTDASQFSCQPSRPTTLRGNIPAAIASRRLPMMNHFLYKENKVLNIQYPNVESVALTNSPDPTRRGSLASATFNCAQTYGGPPTFILVDFFDEGPAIEVIDKMNGVATPIGRVPVPPRNFNAAEASLNARTFAGVRELVKQVELGERPSLGSWIWGAGEWVGGGLDVAGGLGFS